MSDLTAYGRDISGFRIIGSVPVPSGLTPELICAVWQTIFGPDAPNIPCETVLTIPNSLIYRWRRQTEKLSVLIARNTTIEAINLFVEKMPAGRLVRRYELRNGIFLFWGADLSADETKQAIRFMSPSEKLADLLRRGAVCLAVSPENRQADLAALKKELAGLDLAKIKYRQIPGIIFLFADSKQANFHLVRHTVSHLVSKGKLELQEDKIDPKKYLELLG